jgi:two-component system, OmpR family, response regulator AdeR
MSQLILVVEDQREIADIILAYLDREGFRTAHARDGQVAVDLHLSLKPDLVLLDVQLPVIDGWAVLAEIRRRGSTPVIMATALDKDLERLQALRIGADDYVVKPFNPLEVVARVTAVLRRGGIVPKVLRVGRLEIDVEAHHVEVVGAPDCNPLSLTLTEFRLLVHMARQPMKVFERGELVDACLPEGSALDRTVDSHIKNLRRKLEACGVTGSLANVRGVGFRLGKPS